MSHEFGHMLGLNDKYKDDGTPISEEWSWNIMVDVKCVADKRNLDILFGNPFGVKKWKERTKGFFDQDDGKLIYHINVNNREK